MTYVSPVNRAVPTPTDAVTPDAASSLPPRRGEFDYGILGEDWVKAQLPGNDLLPNEDKLVGFTPREPSLLDKHRDTLIAGLCVIAGGIIVPSIAYVCWLYAAGAVS